jgi:gamma-glutamyl phosphate reductase
MIKDMAREAKMASRILRRVGRAQKDAALKSMADKLIDRKAEIAKENEKDLAKAQWIACGTCSDTPRCDWIYLRITSQRDGGRRCPVLEIR